jgi:putative hydrolase of the HAD superfamily
MTVVIFDLGNVILPFDFLTCCKRLASRSPYSPQYIYRHVFESPLMCAYEAGRLTSEEFFAQLQTELQLNLDFASFRRMWEDIFTEDQAVSRIIQGLRAGYRLFLLSNTNELHFEYVCQQFDILGVFEEYILSYQVGCMKPDAGIYEQALKRANIPAEEIVYIDDRLEYAQAAIQQGIRGIHFTGASRLEQELIRYGVRVGPSVC